MPVVNGKIWQRIKGFFKKALGLVAKIAPIAAPAINALIPGGGAIATGIGALAGSISSLTTAATGAAYSNQTNAAVESGEEQDKFEVTPQYRLFSELAPISGTNTDGYISYATATDNQWQSGETMEFPVN